MAGEMRFSATWRAEQDPIGAVFEPSVAGAEGEDLCLGEGWHGVEVECVDGLARWQADFEEMTLNSSAISLGDLMLNESGEQSCGWPGLLVGACGVLGPILLDGGEPEIVEDEGEALCVDHPDSVVHAASPVIRAL